jgi:glutamine amidotransferase-like uncharacterized protein
MNIVLYNDEGVLPFAFSCLRQFFHAHEVTVADARAVVGGDALEHAGLFVMPGGADLPYARKLNGAGNANIRRFVEKGGIYLGICAGAYYGCRAIEFHKGRDDEICGRRELAFIDGVAVGSLPELAPYYNGTLDSAAITDLRFADGGSAQAFYQGGCRFSLDTGSDAEILAVYANMPEQPPAIVRRQVGKGSAILSGVHFEITPSLLPLHPCEDEAEKERLKALIKDFQNPYDGWESLISPSKRA